MDTTTTTTATTTTPRQVRKALAVLTNPYELGKVTHIAGPASDWEVQGINQAIRDGRATIVDAVTDWRDYPAVVKLDPVAYPHGALPFGEYLIQWTASMSDWRATAGAIYAAWLSQDAADILTAATMPEDVISRAAWARTDQDPMAKYLILTACSRHAAGAWERTYGRDDDTPTDHYVAIAAYSDDLARHIAATMASRRRQGATPISSTADDYARWLDQDAAELVSRLSDSAVTAGELATTELQTVILRRTADPAAAGAIFAHGSPEAVADAWRTAGPDTARDRMVMVRAIYYYDLAWTVNEKLAARAS